jgi:hypothetical protein
MSVINTSRGGERNPLLEFLPERQACVTEGADPSKPSIRRCVPQNHLQAFSPESGTGTEYHDTAVATLDHSLLAFSSERGDGPAERETPGAASALPVWSALVSADSVPGRIMAAVTRMKWCEPWITVRVRAPQKPARGQIIQASLGLIACLVALGPAMLLPIRAPGRTTLSLPSVTTVTPIPPASTPPAVPAAPGTATVSSEKAHSERLSVASLRVSTSSTPAAGRERVRAQVKRDAPHATSGVQSAPSRTAPPPAQLSFRGSLAVNSSPTGAQVFVNGVSVGATPLLLSDVPVGSRVVRVEIEGHRRWSSAVRIVANQLTTTIVELRPLPTR